MSRPWHGRECTVYTYDECLSGDQFKAYMLGLYSEGRTHLGGGPIDVDHTTEFSVAEADHAAVVATPTTATAEGFSMTDHRDCRMTFTEWLASPHNTRWDFRPGSIWFGTPAHADALAEYLVWRVAPDDPKGAGGTA